MEVYFQIATDQGTKQVSGHVVSRESLLGIHRTDDRAPWAVTFIPTGTTCDSVFPERFNLDAPAMLERMRTIEERALPAWLAISTLPWGTTTPPDWCKPFFTAIRDAAAR